MLESPEAQVSESVSLEVLDKMGVGLQVFPYVVGVVGEAGSERVACFSDVLDLASLAVYSVNAVCLF